MVDDSSPKELASRPGPKGANQALEMSQGSNFGKPEQKKWHAEACRPNPQEIDRALADQATFPVLHTNRRDRRETIPLFRRSSSAKIAVTGQTGTHAPQSMHSWDGYTVVSRSRNSLHPCADECSPRGRHPHRRCLCAMQGSAIT